MEKQPLFILCLLIIASFTRVEAATYYCPDPLNLQTRTDSATSSAGVVTCPGAQGCGITLTSGGGICTSLTTPSSTVYVACLNAAAASTLPSDISGFTTANGAIKTCWNPYAGAQVTVSPAISATNAILACYTSKAGVGSPIFQTVGATTTASTAVTLGSIGSYCFSTNCNVGYYNKSSTMTYNIALILLGAMLVFFSL